MDDLDTRVADGIGRITLNRPRVLNALTHEMIRGIDEALERWRSDPEVAMVLIDGAGDRGLCAGGDIRGLRQHALDGRNDLSRRFWRDEYELCATIDEYPKPYIALMTGITMGGGVGVSAHGSIRIVTESSRVAMPETRIGFSPDVGGTWLLAHAPGELGTYLGLNGQTMSGADAVACGFADHYVPSDRLPRLLEALGEQAVSGSPTDVVLSFSEAPPASTLEAEREWIDRCYSADSVSEILERLRAESGSEAADAADELGALSPMAVTVALAALRRARGLGSLREALAQEYRTSAWLAEQPDLAEGIRAQVVDKDRSPKWLPSRLATVPPSLAATALGHRPPRH
ncbi:enoyl-CoA hydratase/isomerase family protein [Mycetocola zhujimingii]|uniref:3-hydroxyisobutyryl-CoA hydrolase n=1 Tax=Mycetocola zhujimingii TaxID=2079792 RepID=A0A2U1TD84_9MICO|nr:enoyl-CoA hydratase/isomerase family protein [Mycetocola zhujimingii]PWC06848.1 3-hydroxyisobutyryl-CoA hydrolase [Mycetocola zhujimingii]